MNITSNLKRFFSLVPDRASRYFALTININKSIPVQETMLQAHKTHLKQNQQNGKILYALKSKDNLKFTYFFNSKNEVQPYEFVKANPFKLHNLVESYTIEQIQIKQRVREKELAPNYLRE